MFKNKFQIKSKTQSLTDRTDRGTSRKTGHLGFSNWSKGIFHSLTRHSLAVGLFSSLIYQVANKFPPSV